MTNIVSAGLDLVDTFISKFVKDKDLVVQLKASARSEEFQGQIKLLAGQMEINKIEASSSSMFVAGWRPYVGWVCGIALTYTYVLYPILQFIVAVTMENPPVLPEVEAISLMPILMGMLGLGAMRSHDKKHGVSRESI